MQFYLIYLQSTADLFTNVECLSWMWLAKLQIINSVLSEMWHSQSRLEWKYLKHILLILEIQLHWVIRKLQVAVECLYSDSW